MNLFASDEDLSGDTDSPTSTEDTSGEFGTASAHNSSKSYDFTGIHMQRGVIHNNTSRVIRVVNHPIFDSKDLFPDL